MHFLQRPLHSKHGAVVSLGISLLVCSSNRDGGGHWDWGRRRSIVNHQSSPPYPPTYTANIRHVATFTEYLGILMQYYRVLLLTRPLLKDKEIWSCLDSKYSLVFNTISCLRIVCIWFDICLHVSWKFSAFLLFVESSRSLVYLPGTLMWILKWTVRRWRQICLFCCVKYRYFLFWHGEKIVLLLLKIYIDI